MMRNDSVETPLPGGCACGHVRFEMRAAPIVVHACHCRFCQRVSGSAFGLNAMIEADRVALVGEGAPEIVHTPSALPEGQRFHRCPRCQVALWANHAMLGERIALVNAGVLDEPWRLQPDVHCFTATKHPWVALPEGVPAFEGNYDEAAVWDAAAGARLEKAMGQA